MREEEHDLLDRIESPSGPQAFTPAELVDLSHEIREFLISSISKTGGHLGPNLGIIELTIILRRVFESLKDTLVFDTGHQSYMHRTLTGREDFARSREAGGLSNYPSREESVHDVPESSCAPSSIAWADGISVEKRRQGEGS